MALALTLTGCSAEGTAGVPQEVQKRAPGANCAPQLVQ
jgi:hypothetical protein